MGAISMTDNNKYWQDVEELELSYLADRTGKKCEWLGNCFQFFRMLHIATIVKLDC
jgi:hypothetical protein